MKFPAFSCPALSPIPCLALLVGVTSVLGLAGCRPPASSSGSVAPATTQAREASAPQPVVAASAESPGLSMPERLRLIAENADPTDLPFLNKQRADLFGEELKGINDPQLELVSLPSYAQELVYSGQSEEGIKQLDRLDGLLRKYDPGKWQETIRHFRLIKAIAYLRWGEQENCLFNHTSQSCIVPIEGSGVHAKQRGSRGAIGVLMEMLGHQPNDLTVRWLLNIAHMTLGEYPAKVPKQFLIPPSVFASEFPLKRFHDISGNLGLDINGLSGGIIADDFDGDGNLDLVMSALGLRDPMHFFHNNGDGTFADRTKEVGLDGQTGGLNMIQADFDNDGHTDILILRGGWFGRQGHHPLSLLRNKGDGTFEDVTEKAGLLRFHPTQTAVWFDFNGDGWLDLFVGNETRGGDVNACELFRSNGDGTFTECAKESGVDFVGLVKGAVSSDYDHDGKPDLYLSVQGGKNALFHNDGAQNGDASPKAAWRFTNVAEKAGVTEPINSFSTFFFDYDNDGWDDLFVVGYMFNNAEVGLVAADYLGQKHSGDFPALYHNERNGTFRNVTEQMNLKKLVFGMGINFGDLDNDGWLDFYVGTGTPGPEFLTPNRMFRNDRGKRFQDVTTAGGFGHLQKGHGIAFCDLNNNGSQDIYEILGGAISGDTAFSVLFENPGFGGHWLGLKLEGVQSNRCAMGARIAVVVKTPSGTRTLYRTVGSGGSFGGNPLRQQIGLGDATAVDHVEIIWTNGKIQTVRGLERDKFYSVREGDADAKPMPLTPFAFSKAMPTHHHDHSAMQ